MYLLYISTIFFILYSLKFCKGTKGTKGTKRNNTFHYSKEYNFLLKSVEFYNKDFSYLDYITYNIPYNVIQTIDNSAMSKEDYFIINYNYNNITYKYLSQATLITFPMYTPEQIKNYIYINKITKALIIINEIDSIDILKFILPFLGPNYNFYEDLIKLLVKDILLYYHQRKEIDFYNKLNFENKNFVIIFYDNFKHEYMINDYLMWNPNLIL